MLDLALGILGFYFWLYVMTNLDPITAALNRLVEQIGR